MVTEIESQRASQLTDVEEVLAGISQNSIPSQAPDWDDGDDGEANDNDEDAEGLIHIAKHQKTE
ncbi:hypothetical protein HDU85_004116 [Gaertneriomyces sp. JEL0708]|nr:hypothetical protein HDU85_004116 [Gaertneriomyces sp. JEL0708]